MAADDVEIRRKLKKTAERRDKMVEQLDAVHQELRELVIAGFEAGIPGPVLAEVAGLRKARIYQIRDGVR